MLMEASRARDIPEKYLISLFRMDSGELARRRSISLCIPIGGFSYIINQFKTPLILNYLHRPRDDLQRYHYKPQLVLLSLTIDIIQMNEDNIVEIPQEEVKNDEPIENRNQEFLEQAQTLPLKLLKDHWLTIARPQYKRTCGISSLVSLWNHQFSRLGLGNKDPICIEQAMLKLNLIGKGSIEEGMRKKFKKTGELTQKAENSTTESKEGSNEPDNDFTNKTLSEYIDSVDFGCFTGNDTLLRWYRLLCRIYGGCGRSYLFYKTNSERSLHKTELSAKKAFVQGLNNPNMSFIYHAYDHYFCPVGYEFIPKDEPQLDTFLSTQVNEQGSQLYIMVGESSKMFPGIHVFKWSEIQLDLETYWPKYFNIRRRKEGVQVRAGKENDVPATSTIDCIMAFEKIKD